MQYVLDPVRSKYCGAGFGQIKLSRFESKRIKTKILFILLFRYIISSFRWVGYQLLKLLMWLDPQKALATETFLDDIEFCATEHRVTFEL